MRYLYIFFWLLKPDGLRSELDDFYLGSRQAALGNCSLTLIDVWAASHNQACIAFLKKPGTGIYFENRFSIPGLNLNGLSVAYPFKGCTIGGYFRNFGYNILQENTVGISAGKRFGERLSIGIGLNYQHIRPASAEGIIRSVFPGMGFLFRVNKEFIIGGHLNNPLKTRGIPTVFGLGFRYNISEKIFISCQTIKKDLIKPEFGAGIEYKIFEVLYLRTGLITNPIQSSFGFGLKAKKIGVDFAGSIHPVLGLTPKISICWQLYE